MCVLRGCVRRGAWVGGSTQAGLLVRVRGCG